jgi:hypothetical protein
MIYYLMGDSWRMLIVPAGEIPLILMWGLNVTHLIGMFCFVVFSCCDCARKNVVERRELNDNAPFSQTWKLTISIILIQVK